MVDGGDMGPLYDWLSRPTGLLLDGALDGALDAALDGGRDGIAGFNHPGREAGRFEDFRYDARVRDQVVSLEMFNRRDDYLFEAYAAGVSSPLVACLNAGWRPGLSGVPGRPPVQRLRRGLLEPLVAAAGLSQAVTGTLCH